MNAALASFGSSAIRAARDAVRIDASGRERFSLVKTRAAAAFARIGDDAPPHETPCFVGAFAFDTRPRDARFGISAEILTGHPGRSNFN